MEAKPLPVDLDAIEVQLKQLLVPLLGSRMEIAKITSANQRIDYRVMIVQVEKPALTLVVKLAGPNAPYPCPFERTANLHLLVKAKTTIPMPEVLAADTSCSHFPWRYLVKTFVPGQQWVDILPGLNSEQRASVYKQFGAAVAELHTIDFSGFGSLENDASLQKPQPLLSALTERAKVFIHEPLLLELFWRLFSSTRVGLQMCPEPAWCTKTCMATISCSTAGMAAGSYQPCWILIRPGRGTMK